MWDEFDRERKIHTVLNRKVVLTAYKSQGITSDSVFAYISEMVRTRGWYKNYLLCAREILIACSRARKKLYLI